MSNEGLTPDQWPCNPMVVARVTCHVDAGP